MIWDLTAIQVCPSHRISLLSTCPRCHHPLRWNVIHIGACSCGYELTGQSLDQISTDLGGIALIDRAIARGGWDDNLPKPLQVLTLGQLVELLLILARYEGYRQSRAGFLSFAHEGSEVWKALEAGWQIAKAWPSGYEAFLGRICQQRATSLAEAFGPFYQSLLAAPSGAPHWTILKLGFQDFVERHWRYALPLRDGRVFHVERLPVISETQARKRLARPYLSSKRLLMGSILQRSRGRGFLTTLVTPVPVPEDIPTVAEIIRLLGARIRTEDVKGLEKVLVDRLSNVPQGSSDGIPMKLALRSCVRRGLGKRHLLQALADGQLAVHQNPTVIDRASLHIFFATNGPMTIREAARELDVRPDAVAALLRDGHLGRPINKAGLSRFRAVYVFAFHLARELGTNQALLHRALTRARIDCIQSGTSRLYRRSYLHGIDLAALVDRTSIKRKKDGWSKYKKARRRWNQSD